jgi:hypothetical protein
MKSVTFSLDTLHYLAFLNGECGIKYSPAILTARHRPGFILPGKPGTGIGEELGEDFF